jgi:hypothetical protein
MPMWRGNEKSNEMGLLKTSILKGEGLSCVGFQSFKSKPAGAGKPRLSVGTGCSNRQSLKFQDLLSDIEPLNF